MAPSQAIVFGTLAVALVLFVRGTWRYDMVALLALLLLCLTGIVPAAEAFLGFGHPAVITVAAVLVISAAMRSAGVVDLLGAWLSKAGERQGVHVLILTALVAFCSSFMNNVGALAVLMPVAIQLARTSKRSPSYLLMPLAFGSLLGGLVTMIGTPPNIIIATMRANASGTPFGMFDFAWVGGGVAVIGVLFIGLVGWRLIPQRKGDASVEGLFEIEKYTSELRVTEKSQAIDRTIREVGESVEADYVIIGLAKGRRRISMPAANHSLSAGDILLVEGDAEAIKLLSERLDLELVGGAELRDELLASGPVEVMEAIVKPDAFADGRSPKRLSLRRRFGVNLLGVARQGQRLSQRLSEVRFRVGDILLLQGDGQALQQAMSDLGLLPLAVRDLRIGKKPRVAFALSIFAAALVVSAFGIVPVQISMTACAVLLILSRILTLREAYAAIDWSILVLLGAMIPVGAAMETTGGARLIVDAIWSVSGSLPPSVSIGVLLVASTLLSNIINNAAAAVLMAPIAIRLADIMSMSIDPLMMAVAIGASTPFLTPIGHQSNTLVLGPGGYRFGDFFRLGLPLTLITWGVALPLILWAWPPGASLK